MNASALMNSVKGAALSGPNIAGRRSEEYQPRILSVHAINVLDGIANGSVGTANFDADVAAAVDSLLNASHGCRLQADGGTLSGHNFLIIDGNDNGSYDAGLDYVIDVTGFTGTISAGLFD